MSFCLLYFGSFNPIHLGHSAIAQKALELSSADELRMVLSPQSPHKTDELLAPFEDRAAMIRLAIQDCPQMSLSLIEADLPRPSYTIQSLEHLRASEPETRFALLMGGDNFSKIETWKEAGRILDHYSIYVYARAGYESMIDRPNIHWFEAELLAISATDIRQRISSGQSIDGLVCPKVGEYMMREGLYKP